MAKAWDLCLELLRRGSITLEEHAGEQATQDGFSMRFAFSARNLPFLTGCVVIGLSCGSSAFCQESTPSNLSAVAAAKSTDVSPCGNAAAQPESKRILLIVPNYRTSPCLGDFKPISPKEKFKIASQDAFDRGTVALAAAFAGENQLSNANRSFGQGAEGYGHYFATSYADFVIGDYMTEGVFPTLLHQDPRYFRKGTGTKWGRLGYSCGQIFFTHNDNGKTGFNYSEVLGNSAAVAISTSYYPENRDAHDAIVKLSSQLAVDMAANVLKEFWPEISHKFSRH